MSRRQCKQGSPGTCEGVGETSAGIFTPDVQIPLDPISKILHCATMSTSDIDNSYVSRQGKELVLRLSQIRNAFMSGPHPFQDLPLTMREVGVLIYLGGRADAIMTELATAVDTPLSTATRIIDRLERKGLVVRSKSERDRRLVVISLSEKGRMIDNAIRENELAVVLKMLESLTKGEREILLELMAKVGKALNPAIR